VREPVLVYGMVWFGMHCIASVPASDHRRVVRDRAGSRVRGSGECCWDYGVDPLSSRSVSPSPPANQSSNTEKTTYRLHNLLDPPPQRVASSLTVDLGRGRREVQVDLLAGGGVDVALQVGQVGGGLEVDFAVVGWG